MTGISIANQILQDNEETWNAIGQAETLGSTISADCSSGGPITKESIDSFEADAEAVENAEQSGNSNLTNWLQNNVDSQISTLQGNEVMYVNYFTITGTNFKGQTFTETFGGVLVDSNGKPVTVAEYNAYLKNPSAYPNLQNCKVNLGAGQDGYNGNWTDYDTAAQSGDATINTMNGSVIATLWQDEQDMPGSDGTISAMTGALGVTINDYCNDGNTNMQLWASGSAQSLIQAQTAQVSYVGTGNPAAWIGGDDPEYSSSAYQAVGQNLQNVCQEVAG